jgi:hypothetical protein
MSSNEDETEDEDLLVLRSDIQTLTISTSRISLSLADTTCKYESIMYLPIIILLLHLRRSAYWSEPTGHIIGPWYYRP